MPPDAEYGRREFPPEGAEINREEEPDHLKSLQYGLRRHNPDLLDSLRFAMEDRQYKVLLKQLAKGAFWSASIYAAPFLIGPLIAGRAIIRSRLKQIERRDIGIRPRYPLRPDDRY